MKIDFVTEEIKSLKVFVEAFNPFPLARMVVREFWKGDHSVEKLIGSYDSIGRVDGRIWIKTAAGFVNLWIEDKKYYFVSFEMSDDFNLLLLLEKFIAVLKKVDCPVKIDGRTISLKAAIAIVAFALAKGSWGGDAGILWDMAIDGEL